MQLKVALEKKNTEKTFKSPSKKKKNENSVCTIVVFVYLTRLGRLRVRERESLIANVAGFGCTGMFSPSNTKT